MAKIEVLAQDVRAQIAALKSYRSGWENDIREGWDFGGDEAKEILYGLYEISGTLILALEEILSGHYRGKMAMILTTKKLEKLVKSDAFDKFSALGEAGMCNVITSGTRHHIRVMFECLEILTK